MNRLKTILITTILLLAASFEFVQQLWSASPADWRTVTVTAGGGGGASAPVGTLVQTNGATTDGYVLTAQGMSGTNTVPVVPFNFTTNSVLAPGDPSFVWLGNGSWSNLVRSDPLLLGTNSGRLTDLSTDSQITALGSETLRNAFIVNSTNLLATGIGALSVSHMSNVNSSSFLEGSGGDILVTNVSFLHAYASTFPQATILDSSRLIAMDGGIRSYFSNVVDYIGLGFDQASDGVLNNSYQLIGIGSGVFNLSHINDSFNVIAIGHQALAGSDIEQGSSSIIAIGNDALNGAKLTNCYASIIAIGDGAGANLKGSVNNAVMIGRFTTATNTHDFVLGNSAHNYFFPGSSSQFDGTMTVNGGFAVGIGSKGVGTITTSATGATNTLAANVILYVTAATGATLKDNAGTSEYSGVTIAAFTPVRLQPGGVFTGTAITYATGTASHAW